MKNTYNAYGEPLKIMTWETDISKRNGSTMSFVVKESTEINVGDEIVAAVSFKATHQSTYTIREIKERRPARLKGKEYITAIVGWENKQLAK